MHPLEPYLIRMQEIRASGAGVKETSYYSALEHLLNEVGKTLKPWVRAVSQLKDTGAGSPDFGLFTKEQFPKRSDHEPPQGQMPARGAVEVKSVADDSWLTAKSKQVSKYWGKYRLVLVTNYRDFLLLGADADGKPVVLETYRLASDEQHFWQLAAHPHKAAEEQGERLAEFLKRVMLHAAPLADPKDVAWFLASYAREAKARIDSQPTLPALASLRKGLENALGVRFEKKEGDHFFRSTLVQTLFYGVFSAWVLWHRLGPPAGERFDWKKAGWTLHVPMIRALFDQVASPTKLKALNLVEVLDWVNDVLDRVARDEFFARFAEAEAVQYFYEPFLQAFDPQLRKDLGVWYTPPEIVRYMVARVDRVLREELKLADGLTDDSVVILDPCCGTGAYLVEVLRVIAAGLKERGLGTALAAARLKRAAVERVFGFELMPAPFVVAHLQLGLLLTDNGAALGQEDGSTNGRLGVYLTNALTGWAPPDEEGKQRMTQLSMDFPEFAAEHDAAEVVKQGRKILVVLGNPPYNAFAGVALEEEADLVTIAVLATEENLFLDEHAHLKLTAGWGHAGKGGITMRGKGKLDARPRRDDERSPGDEALGEDTYDVWLNNACYWRNVPRPVWEFTIGGYQAMKKWLSYREFDLLGRALTLDEVEEVTGMARRLAALVLLQARLDDNYRTVAGAAFDWGSVA